MFYPFEKGLEINLTAEEKHIYRQLFLAADEENKGVVTGPSAVKFFRKSGLESSVLSKVGVD
jgi:epidermal growth factor receptor substrate 15